MEVRVDFREEALFKTLVQDNTRTLPRVPIERYGEEREKNWYYLFLKVVRCSKKQQTIQMICRNKNN